MRVLEVLTPVKCLQPDLDWVKRPVLGELLSCIREPKIAQSVQSSDEAYRPMFYDLRERRNGKNVAHFFGISLS